MRATLALGIPLIGSHLAQILIQTTDVVMLGWYGVEELAGTVLATQVYFLVLLIGSGFASAVMPLVAKTYASGDGVAMRQTVRTGAWIALLYALFALIPFIFLEPILLALGQKPELAAVAGEFMSIAQWGIIPGSLAFVLRSVFSAVARPRVVLLAVLSGAYLNGFLNYLLIFGEWGFPEMGVRGCAIASVAATCLMLVIYVAYIFSIKELRDLRLFHRIHLVDFPDLREVFQLGWPISLYMLAEVGMFTVSALLIGAFGTLALATHGIVLQIVTIFFMIPMGLSNAATVRAASFWGAGQSQELVRATMSALVIALAVGVIVTLLYLAFPSVMIPWFLSKDETRVDEIIKMGTWLLVIAAFFQVVDSVQLVTAALLRGLKDTRVPMVYAILSFWVVGIPSGYLLAFRYGYGPAGVWWGLVIGLSVACVLLGTRLYSLLKFYGKPENQELQY